MSHTSYSGLRYRRAFGTFVLAYITITIVAAALSIWLESLMHVPAGSTDPVHTPSYILAEKFYPLLNLIVWGGFSWVYFRKDDKSSVKRALALGTFWLMMALPVDYVGFVLIRHPWSLSAHDFYIGQYPWIYLIYITIAISPLLWTTIHSMLSDRGQTAAIVKEDR